MKIQKNLLHASFFFVDIVGLSDPKMSTETQAEKIRVLNKSTKSCSVFKNISMDEIFIQTTGDGMVIGFLNGIEKPIELAIELQKNLHEYNQNKTELERIGIRIGCHVGHVFDVEDIAGGTVFWGPGTILARRIMDLGGDGHILISSLLADSLKELSEKYEKIIHPIHNFKIKHEQSILIYSVYGENFGNSKSPTDTGNGDDGEKSHMLDNDIVYEKLYFTLQVTPKQDTYYKQSYILKNISTNPIRKILFELKNVKSTISELDLKAYDERKQELTINNVLSNTLEEKKVIFNLNDPIYQNEKKEIIFSYKNKDWKSFEHRFVSDVNEVDIGLSFYSSLNPKIRMFLIHEEKRDEILEMPKINRGTYTRFSWHLSNIMKNDLLEILCEYN